MSILSAQDVFLSFGDRVLLDGVRISLDPGARIALVGANGCGKSTFLGIIAGARPADAGQIIAKKNLSLAYLPQAGIVHAGSTLRQELSLAWSSILDREREIQEIGEQLASGTLTATRQDFLLHRLHEVQEEIDRSSYYRRDQYIEEISTGLGFERDDLEKHCENFSGGWQMRIALAKILLVNPECLLLDEPTNYLDLEAREWLKSYLVSFSGACMLVSHDRFFLDAVATGIAELYQAKIRVFPGNYSTYESKRRLELEQTLAAWKKQQDEIAHLEGFIRRFQYKASKATQAQSRIKDLERMERIELPDGVRSLEFRFPPAPPSSELALSTESIAKGYGSHQVLGDVSVEVRRGDKLAVMGRNGAGKTTLLKILAGVNAADSGKVLYGHHVTCGYFAQDADEKLDTAKTIWEELESGAPELPSQSLRNLLGSFLFSGDDIDKPISVLSGGEKSRVALLKLLLSACNLLVLDEPSNHLDLTSKEILLRALQEFEGAVIFVSHDRAFIEGLATRIIELRPDGPTRPSRMIQYPGSWEYYQWKRSQELDAGSDGLSAEARKKSLAKSEAPPSSNERNREDGKRIKADIRRLEKEESACLATLEELSARRDEVHGLQADPALYADPDRVRALSQELEDIDQREQREMAKWEDTARKLEELRRM